MSLFHKTRTVKPRNYLATLDIGSSKVSCMIARLSRQSGTIPELQLLGLGQQISRGLKNGQIIDMEALEDSILNAVHSAEQQADVTIEEILVSIPALSLSSQIINDTVMIGGHPVDDHHLRRLMSLENKVSPDQHLIHALPLEYRVDDTRGIKDPRGLTGDNLALQLHLITAPSNLIRNLSRCIGRCHLDVAGFVAAPYASGLATLVEDELSLGVTLIDIGGGGTSVASFFGGNLVHLAYVPLGGVHVTYDLARGLSTPVAQAERLKTLYGSVLSASTDDRESILVPLLGEDQTTQINQVPKSLLTHIIRARVEETFQYLLQTLKHSNLEHLLTQRIVLTGGGSQLGGMRDFVASLTGKTVRVGLPQGIHGSQDVIKSPALATSIGLLHYAAQDNSTFRDAVGYTATTGNFFQRFYTWVRENF